MTAITIDTIDDYETLVSEVFSQALTRGLMRDPSTTAVQVEISYRRSTANPKAVGAPSAKSSSVSVVRSLPTTGYTRGQIYLDMLGGSPTYRKFVQSVSTFPAPAQFFPMSDVLDVLESSFSLSQADFIVSSAGGAASLPFTGATNLVAGAAGLVTAPAAGQQNSVLSGSGAWVAIPLQILDHNPASAYRQYEFATVGTTLYRANSTIAAATPFVEGTLANQWTKFSADSKYRGDWALTNSYSLEDLVFNSGTLYRPNSAIAASTAFVEGVAANEWTAVGSPTKYRGDWVLTEAYLIGDVVFNSGALYHANSSIAASTAFVVGVAANEWTAISSPAKFRGDWVLTEAYLIADVVLNAGVLYRANSAIAASTAFVEGVAANEWTAVSRSVFRGDWVLTEAYAASDMVRNNDRLYAANNAIPASTAFAVGTAGATWSVVSSTTFLGPWLLASKYLANDVVMNNGLLYFANNAIPASTAFAVGTVGATWTPLTVKNNVAVIDPVATDDSALFYSEGSTWVNTLTGLVFVCVDSTATAAVWARVTSAKNNFVAVVDPTATDDSSLKYELGSLWFNVSKAFVCVNPTAASAVWARISNTKNNLAAAVDPIATDDVASLYEAGSVWLNTTAGRSFVALSTSVGAAVWTRTSNIKTGSAAVDPTATDDSSSGYESGSVWVNSASGKAFLCISPTATAAVWVQISNAKNNLVAAVDPTATDDSALLYSVGSFWVNTTNDRAFVCVDSTATAAIWQLFSPKKNNLVAIVAPSATDDSALGYSAGSVWYDTVGLKAYLCVDPTVAAALWFKLTDEGIRTYNGTDAYQALEVVKYQGVLYSSNSARTVGVWPATPTEGDSPGEFRRVASFVHPSFNTNYNYAVGDLVVEANKLYRCTTAFALGSSFVASNFVVVGETNMYIGDIASKEFYAVGNVGWRLDRLYRCITAHGTPGSLVPLFDSAKWVLADGPLNNLAAAVVPTATDDSALGYSVGSFWFNTVAKTSYACVDSTVTAAVWTKLGGDTPIIGSVQTANFSAVQGTIHPVDSTGGVITVTPPAVVAAGDWFIVVDSSKLSAINNIVIATTAQLLLGQPDDFVLNSAGKSVKFLYISPAIGWSVSIS